MIRGGLRKSFTTDIGPSGLPQHLMSIRKKYGIRTEYKVIISKYRVTEAFSFDPTKTSR